MTLHQVNCVTDMLGQAFYSTLVIVCLQKFVPRACPTLNLTVIYMMKALKLCTTCLVPRNF